MARHSYERRSRAGRRISAVATVLALLALPSIVAASAPAGATVGGPVILGGDDLTDHGGFDTATATNRQGWLYIEKALQNIRPNVTRANDGSVAALGSAPSTSTSGNAGAAIGRAAAAAGLTVTYHNGGPAITQFFAALRAGGASPAIVWIAGNEAFNDLADSGGAEAGALVADATSIGDFVNSGGGLMSHGSEYGWLSALLPGASTVSSGGGSLALTPAGQSAFPGLTDADVNTGPWHNHFEGDLGGLQVLVRDRFVRDAAGANAPVVIGGAAVSLPGSITLDPATATNPVGTSHTVTATVRNDRGAVQAGVTVSFAVTAGPNAGVSGSGVTDSAGQTSFTYTGSGGAGTDTITASFTDASGTLRSTTASKVWASGGGNTAPAVDAGPDATGPEGAPIAVAGTATDPDGDPVTLGWTATPGAGVDAGAACSFADPTAAATTLTCTDDGSYLVTLTAGDGVNPAASDSATVNVTNRRPAVAFKAPANLSMVARGRSTTVTARFSDPGTNDTHTCRFAWGDGTTRAGTVTESGGAGTCRASHSFNSVGPVTVTVRVTDDDGGVGTATLRLVVFARGGAFALEARGLVDVSRTPNAVCPPGGSFTTVLADLGPLARASGLAASCAVDPGTGTTTATSSVATASLLGGAVNVTGVRSDCVAAPGGTTSRSTVATINGLAIGSAPLTLDIAGVKVVVNEVRTGPNGRVERNAVRMVKPPTLGLPAQEIIVAGCYLN